MVVLIGRGVRLDQRTVQVSDQLCACGCGERTMVSPKTRTDRGWVKGQARRFVYGHGLSAGSPTRPRGPGYRLRIVYVRWTGPVPRCGRPMVERKPKVIPTRYEDRGYETPCKIWLGSVDKHGYPRVSRGRGKAKGHREAFEEAFGPIPGGHDVHHKCEVKLCVEPSHLQALTPDAHGQLHGEVWRRAA